jgi:pantoate--beta-alanine ligase
MQLIQTINDTRQYIASLRKEGATIGFVPTMGALHEGHLELVRKACRENDYAVVSIFVNPIQFNNPEDLKKYPRTLKTDLEKLEATKCSMVFAPSADEMYPTPDTTLFDFGDLEKVMEGQFRPGHFNGVGIVVKKLFEIVAPDKAYFGEKDFQQLAVINKMVKILKLPVEIIPCPIIREEDGLAMSSRNERLTPEERSFAPSIYETLCRVKENYSWFTPEGIGKMVIGDIEQNPLFRVEYAQVVDIETLQPFSDWEDTEHAILCIAVFLGQVRLIDNIVLY